MRMLPELSFGGYWLVFCSPPSGQVAIFVGFSSAAQSGLMSR
jgi:hypothetical protein